MLTSLLEGLGEQAPGCTSGQPRELRLCKAGEVGNSCRDRWFQNQTLFAAAGDSEAATRAAGSRAASCLQEPNQHRRSLAASPLPTQLSSGFRSSYEYIRCRHRVTPRSWLQVHPGRSLSTLPSLRQRDMHRGDVAVNAEGGNLWSQSWKKRELLP